MSWMAFYRRQSTTRQLETTQRLAQAETELREMRKILADRSASLTRALEGLNAISRWTLRMRRIANAARAHVQGVGNMSELKAAVEALDGLGGQDNGEERH